MYSSKYEDRHNPDARIDIQAIEQRKEKCMGNSRRKEGHGYQKI